MHSTAGFQVCFISGVTAPPPVMCMVRRFLAARVNESRTNQSDKPPRTWVRTVVVRLAWFALLFVIVAGLSLYGVASSFPLPGGSAQREGMAAFHESVGSIVVTVIHSPFSWLHDYVDGKSAGLLVWLFWATGFFALSALLRRPRWVFSIHRTRHEPGNA